MKKIVTLLLMLCATISMQAQTQFINDPSFELSGAGGTQWSDTDYYFNNTIVNYVVNARTGDYSAYFETVPGITNQCELTQNLLVSTATYNSKLELYIKCTASSGSSTDLFGITLDGVKTLYLLTGLKTDSASIGPNYKKISINIDTLTFGIHNISFIGTSVGNSSGRNLYIIDDVTITAGFPTAINNTCNNNCDIQITPTITKDIINISNTNTEKLIAKIFNFNGQLLQTKQLAVSPFIDIANLASNYYLLIIQNEKGEVLNKTKIYKE
jgi:hypothetical protein